MPQVQHQHTQGALLELPLQLGGSEGPLNVSSEPAWDFRDNEQRLLKGLQHAAHTHNDGESGAGVSRSFAGNNPPWEKAQGRGLHASSTLTMLHKWCSLKSPFNPGTLKVKSSWRGTNVSQSTWGCGQLGEVGAEGPCAQDSVPVSISKGSAISKHDQAPPASGLHHPGATDLGLGGFCSFLPFKALQTPTTGRARSESEDGG